MAAGGGLPLLEAFENIDVIKRPLCYLVLKTRLKKLCKLKRAGAF